MLAMQYNDTAGRTAYLAGFHAAQALISERSGRAVKTHGGVNTDFHRLVRNDAHIDDELRAFLGFAYNLKAIADYETGPGAEVSAQQAMWALAQAKQFVGHVEGLLA